MTDSIKMKTAAIILFLFAISPAFAQQKTTFDIATYTVPSGWKETKKTKDVVSYAITNNSKGTYCQIAIFASTVSKGNITADFESEWQELVVKPYNPTKRPELIPKQFDDGWEVQAGVAPFTFNGGQSIAMLATMSGYERCISLVMASNTEAYQNDVTRLMESVVLQKPAITKTETASSPVKNNTNPTPPAKTNFAFNTTTFDNGWTSTVQEDWVQVEKGNIKVLLHYPNKTADEYNSSVIDGLKTAWNTLVAPRYSSGSNFNFISGRGWQVAEFGEADLVEKRTGKSVHVVLFKKNYSNGSGKYMEVISNDKKSFEAEFGAFDVDASSWDNLENMVTYNKFAVAASDLKGKWTNDFTGTLQYVNAYTGASAGMDTHASKEHFEFLPGNTYKWDLTVASGMVGNIKFQSVKSNGKFSLPNNWQVSFSDLEGKPKTYEAHFTCVKGTRILWLGDTGYGKVE